MSKLRILAISGSTKRRSSSLSILHFIKEKYDDYFDLVIYDKLADLAQFNPDLESDLPKSVIEIRELIQSADGVLFCTPEYVFSLPGSLKNLIDWQVATTLFSKKAVAIIVAAASGKKAFESLDLILTTIEASLEDDSKLLIQGAKGKLDEAGKINNEQTVLEIDTLVQSFLKCINNSDRIASKYTTYM